jgi:hypothetical protein
MFYASEPSTFTAHGNDIYETDNRQHKASLGRESSMHAITPHGETTTNLSSPNITNSKIWDRE